VDGVCKAGRSSIILNYFIFIILSGVGVSPVGTAATGLLYQPQVIDNGDNSVVLVRKRTVPTERP
jgi:hypothetical protein